MKYHSVNYMVSLVEDCYNNKTNAYEKMIPIIENFVEKSFTIKNKYNEKTKNKYNFFDYSDEIKQTMYNDAVERVILAIYNKQLDVNNNVFSYITTIVSNSFINVINRHHRRLEKFDDYRREMISDFYWDSYEKYRDVYLIREIEELT